MLIELINKYCSDCLHVQLLCYLGKKSLGEPLPYLRSTIRLTGANSLNIRWLGGWVGGWMNGWMIELKALLWIAYSNKKITSKKLKFYWEN
jgi:hypothetical protein